jgi:hypothetical protein
MTRGCRSVTSRHLGDECGFDQHSGLKGNSIGAAVGGMGPKILFIDRIHCSDVAQYVFKIEPDGAYRSFRHAGCGQDVVELPEDFTKLFSNSAGYGRIRTCRDSRENGFEGSAGMNDSGTEREVGAGAQKFHSGTVFKRIRDVNSEQLA